VAGRRRRVAGQRRTDRVLRTRLPAAGSVGARDARRTRLRAGGGGRGVCVLVGPAADGAGVDAARRTRMAVPAQPRTAPAGAALLDLQPAVSGRPAAAEARAAE